MPAYDLCMTRHRLGGVGTRIRTVSKQKNTFPEVLVTLSCNTWLPSDRATTQLRYSFFKDGHTLQSGWTSSKFTISAISKEDSGNYWCEAMTASRSVSKQSHRSYIDVESERLWVGMMGLSQAGIAGVPARLQAPLYP